MSTAYAPPPSTRAPRYTGHFGHIRQILNDSVPKLDGDGVAGALDDVYTQLNNSGATAASERLEDIDSKVEKLRFDVIRDIVAPDQALEELNYVGGKWSRRIGAARNVLALLPLLLTWAALGWASAAYHTLLDLHGSDPSITQKPFIDLWQTSFGGQAGPPLVPTTFSGAAGWDFFFLFVLIVFTAIMHIREGIEEKRANNITGLLNKALTRLAIELQQHEKIRNETDIGSAAQAVTKAINTTRDSMQGIADANKGVVEQAKATMQTLTEHMRDAVKAFKDDYEAFVSTQTTQAKTTLETVARQTQEVFDGKLGPNIEKFTRAAQQFDQSSHDLGDAATALTTSSDSLEQTTSEMNGHIASLNTNIHQVGEEASGMRDAANGVIENNRHMDEANARLDVVSRQLADITSQLFAVSQHLNAAAGNLAAQTGYTPPSDPGAEDDSFIKRVGDVLGFGRKRRQPSARPARTNPQAARGAPQRGNPQREER